MALDYDQLMATKVVDLPLSYDDSEAILYALSVGMGRDPLDLKELPYVYEQGEAFKTVPTLATVLVPDLFPPGLGWDFNHTLDPFDAGFVVILISVWKQVSVNFIFFLSGLQGIPNSVMEAARLDCRSDGKRFWTITFPLLAPTTFFLIVINITYAFFETFGIIDTTTRGAPAGSTTTLVYKVFQDGFLGADLGGSSAQSVVLMLMVLALTVMQFRFIERKIHY